MATPPRITLTSFLKFTSAAGVEKAGVPGRERRMYEDPRSFLPFYEPMKRVITGSLVRDDLTERLAAVVDRARPVAKPHFRQLAEGVLALQAEHAPTEVVAKTKDVHTEHLTIGVPYLKVVTARGPQAWFLYFKEPLLTQAAVDPVLVLLGDVVEGLPARVVDVRRAQLLSISSKARTSLRRYTDGEVASFAYYWHASRTEAA